jgi:hypothetical protein
MARGGSSAGLERRTVTAEVAGSNPVHPATMFYKKTFFESQRKSFIEIIQTTPQQVIPFP